MAVAIVAAIAAVIGAGAQAYAVEGLPEEDNVWTPESYDGAGQIYSGDLESEARDNRSHIIRAWRGNDNNGIWISVDRQSPRALPATNATQFAQTEVAPTVIWTDNGGYGNFRIFHTGRDGNIYQTRVQLDVNGNLPSALPTATQVPNSARTNSYNSPTAAALPNNSFILTWSGLTGPDVWNMYFNATNNTWNNPTTIPGASTVYAPAIAAESTSWNQVVAAWRGLDGRVYYSRQRIGTSTWTTPVTLSVNLPRTTNYSPSVALTTNGYGVISMVDTNGNQITSAIITRNGTVGTWYNETTHVSVQHSVLVVAIGFYIYYVRNINGALSYKAAGSFFGYPLPPAPNL
jgi:hypothetical protein